MKASVLNYAQAFPPASNGGCTPHWW